MELVITIQGTKQTPPLDLNLKSPRKRNYTPERITAFAALKTLKHDNLRKMNQHYPKQLL